MADDAVAPKRILLDTHAWAWSLTGNLRLSPTVVGLVRQTDELLVSPVSFYEIGQKVRLGKWAEMQSVLPRIFDLLARQDGAVAPVTAEVAVLAATLDWQHRDPFDRLIAATAINYRAVLVSADTAFDSLSTHADWPGRVW